MRTSFHHQPEAQHPKYSAIHEPPADYPISGEPKRSCGGDGRRTESDPIRKSRARFCCDAQHGTVKRQALHCPLGRCAKCDGSKRFIRTARTPKKETCLWVRFAASILRRSDRTLVTEKINGVRHNKRRASRFSTRAVARASSSCSVTDDRCAVNNRGNTKIP